MKDKKIAVLVDMFPKLSETFIVSQITGLIDRGFDVEIWAWNRSNEKMYHPDIDLYGLLSKTRYLTCPSSSREAQTVWHEEFIRNNNNICVSSIELFHVHFGNNFNAIKPFLLRVKQPIVVSFHGNDASQYIKQMGDNCYADLFSRVDIITTPSHQMKDVLISKGCPSAKVCVHRCGVDLKIFTLPQAPKIKTQLRILTVARLVEKKGIEYVLRAFALLKDKNVSYRIVGDGPLEKQLKALTRTLELENKVVFLGAKTKAVVIEEMQLADIFVLTSITSINGDKEGLPVTLIEAHSAGVPVVSTRHAGIPELVEDGKTGLLSEEGDIKGIAANLKKFIESSELRQVFSQNARKKVKNEFDINLLNDKLAFLYKGLLEHLDRTTR